MQFFIQSEVKPKPTEIRTCFSARQLQVVTLIGSLDCQYPCDWLE